MNMSGRLCDGLEAWKCVLIKVNYELEGIGPC